MVRYLCLMALPWVLLGPVGGCLPAWRPPMDRVEPAAAHALIDLTRYVGPSGPVPRAYLRRNPVDPDEPPTRYERRAQKGALTEGLLADRGVDTVAAYLEPTPGARYRRGTLWPEDPNKEGAGFFLEFDPALIRLPASIDAKGGISQQCRLRYYNRDAVEVRGGTARRNITFEGFETVQAGGIEYPACARLRIDTSYRIHWGPWVDTNEYIWLAPGIGEVLRVERFSGLAWFVYFTGLHNYELIDGPATSPPQTQPARLAYGSPLLLQAWSRCAVFLDRLLPRPRLGGLAVEFAPADGAGALAVAGLAPPRQAKRER